MTLTWFYHLHFMQIDNRNSLMLTLSRCLRKNSGMIHETTLKILDLKKQTPLQKVMIKRKKLHLLSMIQRKRQFRSTSRWRKRKKLKKFKEIICISQAPQQANLTASWLSGTENTDLDMQITRRSGQYSGSSHSAQAASHTWFSREMREFTNAESGKRRKLSSRKKGRRREKRGKKKRLIELLEWHNKKISFSCE